MRQQRHRKQNVTDHRKDTKKLDLTFVFLGNNKLIGVKFVHVEGSSLAFQRKLPAGDQNTATRAHYSTVDGKLQPGTVAFFADFVCVVGEGSVWVSV